MSQYPEHEKMKAVKAQSQAIGEFLEWLQGEKKVHLCKHNHEARYFCSNCGEIPEKKVRTAGIDWECYDCRDEDKESTVDMMRSGYYPFNFITEKLLAEYFEIDLKKIEEEKDAMLEEMRATTEAAS